MRPTQAAKNRPPRRSRAIRLDPYVVDGTTLTLEEWRRINQPAAKRGTRATAGRRTRPTTLAA